MSKFKIPNEERKFGQANNGDGAGNVWLSQNSDFKSNKGKLQVSPRLIINQSSSGDENLGRIVAFAKYQHSTGAATQGYWAVCDTVLFKTLGNPTRPNITFTQDTIASTPTDLSYKYSDMIVAPNGLLVSNGDDIYLFNGLTWASYWKGTLSNTMNVPSVYHPLEVLFNLSVAIGDGNYINTIVSPYTDTNETKGLVTLRSEDKIVWIKSASTRVYIGTINSSGGEGLVYEWDGASATTTRAYKIGATGALAGVIKDDKPYIVTSDGSLKEFNGAGFTTIAQLPHTNSSYMLKDSTLINYSTGNDRWIHPNGMKLIDGNINILINNRLEETTGYTNLIENEPSGIWEYDEEIGLYHKYSFTLDSTGALDSGQNTIGFAGALFETKAKEAALLAGASVYTDNATTLKHAIFYDELPNTIAKVGVICTPWLQSFEIEDVWQKLWLKFKELDNSTDEIIVKYRTRKDKNLPAIYSATYTSTTTFTITSTTNLLTTTNILNIGGEVELIMASGAGKSAHISLVSMTESAGTWTYTVTVDEAICPASGTGKVRFNNWTKLASISNQNITDKVFALGKTSTELQIKLELRGTGNNPEINQLVILSNTQLPIK